VPRATQYKCIAALVYIFIEKRMQDSSLLSKMQQNREQEYPQPLF
jgi:hypothetical protein